MNTFKILFIGSCVLMSWNTHTLLHLLALVTYPLLSLF